MTQACEGQAKQEQRAELKELLRDMDHTDFWDNDLIYHTMKRLVTILMKG